MDEVWLVTWDHWGADGTSIEGVFATEEAAKSYAAEAIFKLDYTIERWDVTK